MKTVYSSSSLAKQVSEKLGLNEADGLALYKELAEIPDGHVKDALYRLSSHDPSVVLTDFRRCYPILYEKMIRNMQENAAEKDRPQTVIQ